MMTDEIINDNGVAIPVDPEPFSLMMMLLVSFIVSTILSYLLFVGILGGTVCNPIAFFIAVLVAYGIIYIGEQCLKPRWPVNKFVQISESNIYVSDKNRTRQSIDPRLQVNVLAWYFVVSKRTRVPKGWHMVALALEQSDVYIPVFTLLSPEDFKNMPQLFTQLMKREETKASDDLRMAASDMRQAGLQRRLHVAESARNFDGVEMTRENFVSYIDELQKRFPLWMPQQ